MRLGDGYTVNLYQIPKNNGILLDGLCIGRPDERLAPTIYLNAYYQLSESGMTLDAIVTDILEIYRNNCRMPGIPTEQFTEFEALKELVAYKLVHAASNSQLLCQIPHFPFLDLAIVFYLFLDSNDTGQMTALIYNDHLNTWNVTPEELFHLARLNTPRILPAEIKCMEEVMKELAKKSLGEDYREELMDGPDRRSDSEAQDWTNQNQMPLYVLTNRTGLNGACCMLYDHVLKDFAARMGRDILILPSSIHEVLLTTKEDDFCCEELLEMVTSINRSEVPPEDQLSNQIYLYSRAEDQVLALSNSSVPVGTTNP